MQWGWRGRRKRRRGVGGGAKWLNFPQDKASTRQLLTGARASEFHTNRSSFTVPININCCLCEWGGCFRLHDAISVRCASYGGCVFPVILLASLRHCRMRPGALVGCSQLRFCRPGNLPSFLFASTLLSSFLSGFFFFFFFYVDSFIIINFFFFFTFIISTYVGSSDTCHYCHLRHDSPLTGCKKSLDVFCWVGV